MVQWLLSNFQNFLFQIEKLLSQKAKLLNFFIHIINRAIKNCFGPDCAAKFVQWQWMNYSSKQRQPSRVFSLSIYLDVYGWNFQWLEQNFNRLNFFPYFCQAQWLEKSNG